MIIKEHCFVRCKYSYADCDEIKYSNDPRVFYYGKVIKIDEIREVAIVGFYDVNGISKYYDKPENMEVPISSLYRAKIKKGATVATQNKKCTVLACNYNPNTNYYDYYLYSEDGCPFLVSEDKIIASFNDGLPEPKDQLLRYEFQNPVFFFGHIGVAREMQVIEKSLYGFKELAGCKIVLEPHQLRTVMICLQQQKCRFMLADEVGLGKTIEALSVLKIYFSNNKHKNVGIFVPKPLIEQWKTELAFKFKLFEGENINKNTIKLCCIDDLLNKNSNCFDFVIIDEVHRIINEKTLYNALLKISESVDNILMLSATPIQKRKDEYKMLLTLINPAKYKQMGDARFDELLNLQDALIRKIYKVSTDLLSYEEGIRDECSKEELSEIYDELINTFKTTNELIKDNYFKQLVDSMSFDFDDHCVGMIRNCITYLCDNYQLEKAIIRNRRSVVPDQAKRELIRIPYNWLSEQNGRERSTQEALMSWIDENKLFDKYSSDCINLIHASFSSASAFNSQIKAWKHNISPSQQLLDTARKWVLEENEIKKNIFNVMDETSDSYNRITTIIDFIDNNTKHKKVILFTDFPKTFSLYKEILNEYFGSEYCAFFSSNMDQEELESNAYRFQNSDQCMILLSDPSGGEGRNFQIADFIIHIDLPWEANSIEQRIGRLDRLTRNPLKPVVSIVPYAEGTIENDLFEFWNTGLNIFQQSQSGLEIVMDTISDMMINAFRKDVKFGLLSITDEVVELIKNLTEVIKRERVFDLSAYQYSELFKRLNQTLTYFNQRESKVFGDAMMSWASLSGFNGIGGENTITFVPSRIALNALYKTLFVPPDLIKLINSQMNVMRNKVRLLTGIKEKNFLDKSIIGTFDRKYALSNDYIHFFAPGDEIFDSITENAMTSYKGTCAAFSVFGDLNWTGLVFFWRLQIDEFLLLKNSVNSHLLNQFMGYLPMEELIGVYSLSDSNFEERDIINQFRKTISFGFKKPETVNLGKRSNGSIDSFKRIYPKEQWEKIVESAYNESLNAIKAKIQKQLMSSAKELEAELHNKINAESNASLYYGNHENPNIEQQIEIIKNALANPVISLDSVCFINVVKKEHE